MSLDPSYLPTLMRRGVEIKQYIEQGKSPAWIMQQMRLTRRQYNYAMRMANIPTERGRKRNPIDRRFITMYRSYRTGGFSKKQIAQLLGVSLSTVRRGFKRIEEELENVRARRRRESGADD